MSNINNILYLEANEDGTIGGSHYCLLEIVKNLDKNKYKPFVCFYQDNTLITEFEKYANTIVITDHHGFVTKERLPKLYSLCETNILLKSILSICQKTYNLIRHDLYLYFVFAGLLHQCQINIVHFNNEPSMTHWLVAAKIMGIKCVSHIRGNPDMSWIKKKLIKCYDKIISISNSVTTESVKKGIDTNNYITIHDGIDVNAVLNTRAKSPEETRSEFQIRSSDIVIGFVGNIKEWKGQHVLIEAIKNLIIKYPVIKCMLVGAVSELEEDRDYYERLHKMVAELDLTEQIMFTGYREDIADIITIFDVMIHASTQPEPLGRVVLEGMLLGKIVIATAHGGPLEIIEDNISGILVKPSDPGELADRIDMVLEKPGMAENMSNNAKKRVNEYFDIGTNVNKIEALYDELLSASR